jgi:prephenate dehydrogenase
VIAGPTSDGARPKSPAGVATLDDARTEPSTDHPQFDRPPSDGARPQSAADRPEAEADRPQSDCLIVGAGLIGASIGLALTQAGRAVHLLDADPELAAAAAALGAGRPWRPQDGADIGLVVVAVPPILLAPVAAEQLDRFPRATVTDVGSVKGPVLAELVALGADIGRYVGSHPMAGSHRSGPLGARADLFAGRVWVVAPPQPEDYARTAAVEALARACGARPVIMSAAEHDVAVAQVSHLPQLISSLLAGRLNAVPHQHLALAGPGMRDVTRIAQSDPELWGQIVSLNQAAVRSELEAVQADLAALIAQLDQPTAVRRVVERGRAGVMALPGKHGHRLGQAWEPVVVEIPDRPGALADIFATVALAQANVEDVAIEHDPKREVGYLTLLVDGPTAAARLGAAMVTAGWRLRP